MLFEWENRVPIDDRSALPMSDQKGEACTYARHDFCGIAMIFELEKPIEREYMLH